MMGTIYAFMLSEDGLDCSEEFTLGLAELALYGSRMKRTRFYISDRKESWVKRNRNDFQIGTGIRIFDNEITCESIRAPNSVPQISGRLPELRIYPDGSHPPYRFTVTNGIIMTRLAICTQICPANLPFS